MTIAIERANMHIPVQPSERYLPAASDIRIFVDSSASESRSTSASPDSDIENEPVDTRRPLCEIPEPSRDCATNPPNTRRPRNMPPLPPDLKGQQANICPARQRHQCSLDYYALHYYQLRRKYIRLLVRSGQSHNRAFRAIRRRKLSHSVGLGILVPGQKSEPQDSRYYSYSSLDICVAANETKSNATVNFESPNARRDYGSVTPWFRYLRDISGAFLNLTHLFRQTLTN